MLYIHVSVRITNRWSEQPPSNYKSKIYIFASPHTHTHTHTASHIQSGVWFQHWIAHEVEEVRCVPHFYSCRFSIYFRVLNLTSICFWQWVLLVWLSVSVIGAEQRAFLNIDIFASICKEKERLGMFELQNGNVSDTVQQHLFCFLHMFPVLRCFVILELLPSLMRAFDFYLDLKSLPNRIPTQTTDQPHQPTYSTGLFIYLLILSWNRLRFQMRIQISNQTNQIIHTHTHSYTLIHTYTQYKPITKWKCFQQPNREQLNSA